MTRLLLKRLNNLGSLLVAVSLLIGASAFGQNQTAQISGLITDASGGVVPAASVTLLNNDDGVKRTSQSNKEGYYVVPLLQPGHYTITVKANGFQTVTQLGVTLGIMQNSRVDFALQVGPVQQSVQVVANASPLNVESPELKAGISPQTILDLPLIMAGGARSVGAFVTLIPGVTSQSNETEAMHMNGGVEYEGETVLDGVGIQYNSGGNGMFNLISDFPQSPDMISEVKVLTSNFEPQYGNSASGAVILETRSGTDAFHGSAYEYNRNTGLNARQFDAATRPPDIENEFGARIGGPAKIPGFRSARSKLFFFVDYERYRSAGSLTSPVISIPSELERIGNFTDWTDSSGNLIPIYDPATTQPNPNFNPSLPTAANNLPYIRQQFMGCDGNTPNVICPTDPRLQNSIANGWLQFLPTPTYSGPLNNYLAPHPPTNLYQNRNFLDTREDEYIGNKDKVFVSVYDETDVPVSADPDATAIIQRGCGYGPGI